MHLSRTFRPAKTRALAILPLIALLLLTAIPAAHASTLAASPVASPEAPSGQCLAIADPEAELRSVYTLPDRSLAGTIEGVRVQSHAGFLPMPTGTLLFIDEAASRLVEVGIVEGAPSRMPGPRSS